MHAYAIYSDGAGTLLHEDRTSTSQARIVRQLEEGVPDGMRVAGIVFTDEVRAFRIVAEA